MAYTRNKIVRHQFQFLATASNGLTQSQSLVPSSIEMNTTRSGAAVPRYRAIIREGNNATSAFDATFLNLVDVKPFRGFITHKGNGLNPPLYREAIVGTSQIPLPAFSNQVTGPTSDVLALTRLYKRLREQQSHAKGLQFLGELGQTLRMIRSPFRSAIKLVDNYTKKLNRFERIYGHPRKSRRGKDSFLSAASDSWLEVAFGIKPLISDVKELAEAAARMSHDTRRERISASETVLVFGQTSSASTATSTNYILLKENRLETLEHRSRYLAALDWSRSAAIGSLERVVELSGFRLDHFVPTMYELMPYSFLLDYFSNLGDVITTGCQCQSAVKWCVLSTSVTSVMSVAWNPQSSGVLSVVSNSTETGTARLIRKRVRRTSYGGLPSIPFIVGLPGGREKYVNMLALWGSTLRRLQF